MRKTWINKKRVEEIKMGERIKRESPKKEKNKKHLGKNREREEL